MSRPSSYPQQLRERAVRMVAETRADYPSEFEAIKSIAAKLGIVDESRATVKDERAVQLLKKVGARKKPAQ